jgi:peptidase E
MKKKRGMIALMGSGELTESMVEVHKNLFAGLPDPPHAVFLDTPAGFQPNVDQISRKAVEYFRIHVQQPMSVVSFKSSEPALPYEAEKAFSDLRGADFIMIGPGSPTYAVRQWKQTPIPEIITGQIEAGGCLVAASAAALTVGRFTLPVYEVYKVGSDLHWVEGMNTLGHFGFDMVVVPHWNNAEGGTHDTRFCYMGEPRFKALESLLPEDIAIFGLDEHTACLIDLASSEALVSGIGRVTLRTQGKEMTFEKGDRFSLKVLREADADSIEKAKPSHARHEAAPSTSEEEPFWKRVHAIENAFHEGLEGKDPEKATNALLELDRTIWKAQQDLESEEFISQAREILRELVVLLGVRLEYAPSDMMDCLSPLVEALLDLRKKLRKKRRWQEADSIRYALDRAGIIVEDTEEGTRWRLKR